MKNAYDVIVRPIITEDSMMMMDDKRYVFEVHPDATKPEIATAIETAFGVKVDSVNVINVKKKPKRLGVHMGYTRTWKKAFVTLKADSKTIEFFDGLK